MKRILWMLLFCALLVCPAGAVADDAFTAAQREAYGADLVEHSLPEDAYETFGNVTLADAAQPQTLLNQLWERLTGETAEIVSSAMQNAAAVLLLCFLAASVRAFSLGAGQAEVLAVAGAAAVAAVCARHVSACIPVGVTVISTLSEFSKTLLPALCAAAVASGAVTSGGVKYAVSALVLDLLATVGTQVLLPALYAYAAVVIAGNVLQNEILLSLSSLIKRAVRLLLVCTAGLFTGYLALTGLLNGTVDAAAAKAAKTAVSTALPVVGGILSDAAETLLSSAAILRNGVGVLGLVSVLAVCLLPYVSLGVHYLLYQLISGLCAGFSDKRVTGLLRGFSDIYAMLLGTVGTVSFVLFAAIASLMRAVSA